MRTSACARPGTHVTDPDPETGRTQGEPVTGTFHHSAADLVDVTLTDGGHLTSTRGHRFFVPGRGWTLASDLRPGNTLRTPDGVRSRGHSPMVNARGVR